MTSPKQRAARFLPSFLVELLDRLVFRWRRGRVRLTRRLAAACGYNIVKRDDYYSVLPVLEELQETRDRWDRPSDLVGLDVDVAALRDRLAALADRWEDDYRRRAGSWADNQQRGFGPGYPLFDARTLYYTLREEKPRRYLEVGSGLSTYYASLAAAANAEEGHPLQVSCVEPYPYDALRTIDGIELIQDFVQNVPLDRFTELEAGDVLFIDSSHTFKIDSDVAFLLLEVLPRLRPGVIVHIHDVPFPFNTPYPADFWMFGERWPVYWNEAMTVQTFLAFNSSFRVELSTPLVRHHDEAFLTGRFSDYVRVADDPNPPSSLWLRRVDGAALADATTPGHG
ncbi:class I SAM-dependent methyltransferase [Nocardioides albidus]|uniref:Class I SAM-dependent methyltransferase n=1 Tax=Nocardioides albidus TaxID=1517589 RepID=A0A5C4W7P9_9ACTN|nr:class I SAM-dependent methyltransferase [Nocardioides albidus]TNM44132.1 class I SAM-dependent methyltransferase [Nocardioides albidus]